MLTRFSRAAIALLAVLGLVLSVDAATYAATGDSLVLGKVNKSKKTTVVKSTGKGPALSLKSKAGAPPLAVSNDTKVANLNADSVDGLDGAALSNDTLRYTFTAGGAHFNSATFSTPPVAPGTYVVTLRTSLNAAAPGNVQCVLDIGGVNYAGALVNYTGNYDAIIAGSDIVTIAAPTSALVRCASQSAGAYDLITPIRVSFTKTNLVTDGVLTKG